MNKRDDDLILRFWAKVKKTKTCWLWQGATAGGYGQIHYRGKLEYAHRIAYEWSHGAIPAGLVVDHTCHNRGCVNPSHLRPATYGQNSQNRQGPQKRAKSGVRGVFWDKHNNKWVAGARLNNKYVNLGRYDSIRDAEVAVTDWRRKHMPYSMMDQRGDKAA